jgi:hypothetical protein
LSFNPGLVVQTLTYYFWQVLIPKDNQPVKGLNYEFAGAVEVVHLLFLLLLGIIFWGRAELALLAAGHVLLVPFLGFLPAPYMNVAWVSDQHLYLALPPLLAFWLALLGRVTDRRLLAVPFVALALFAYKTYEAAAYYEDNTAFYEASLAYNSLNLPIAYNLAIIRVTEGQLDRAYEDLSYLYELGKEEPLFRKNLYFPLIVDLYLNLERLKVAREGARQ